MIETQVTTIKEELQHKIDFKTKPLGALGRLEDLALQIGMVQNTLTPQLRKPTMLVFAADHGIASEGVSAYPAEVTPQMVLNFLNGGAAINVFCRQNDIQLKVVDAGVNYDFEPNEFLIDAKIAKGTKNFLTEDAISRTQVQQCFQKAKEIVTKEFNNGCNIIGFGEMGIGNTSSASMLMSVLCNIPIEDCVGRGTGLNEEQYNHKIYILKEALENHPVPESVFEAMEFFGGFEIVQMCAAMLIAYEKNMLLMVDGFIATAAFLCAYEMNKKIIHNTIFCHQSNEQGHKKILERLHVKPLLNLDLRLGEGTGCALAFPLIQSAVNFLNEMQSFESAGVSNKS